VAGIKRAERKAERKARIYFNDCARAKAIRNGFLLMDMLSIEHKQKEIKLQDQFYAWRVLKPAVDVWVEPTKA
jgi:hypothetical protein